MSDELDIEPDIEKDLRSIYEEIMWLSGRPNVTPGRARAWYTHIMAERVKRKLRQFTGQVSQAAIERTTGQLMLEHYERIQTKLSKLVERHRASGVSAPDEFVKLVVECERVNIVTREENYEAMKAKGDYTAAGIRLVEWKDIPPARKAELWKTMLRGKVANAEAFSPEASAQQVAPGDVPDSASLRPGRA